jgi:hypothetical protein
MIEKANTLDILGYYLEADKIDRFITSQFNLKKRKPNPILTIQNQINGLGAKLDDFMSDQGGNDTPPEEKQISVTVDDKPVEFTEK